MRLYVIYGILCIVGIALAMHISPGNQTDKFQAQNDRETARKAETFLANVISQRPISCTTRGSDNWAFAGGFPFQDIQTAAIDAHDCTVAGQRVYVICSWGDPCRWSRDGREFDDMRSTNKPN